MTHCDRLLDRNEPLSSNVKGIFFEGSRLGLKRIVTKTIGDEPTNKKERETIPLPKGTRCFNVLFAKHQTKKNKTWENDGFLTAKDGSLVLKNARVRSRHVELIYELQALGQHTY